MAIVAYKQGDDGRKSEEAMAKAALRDKDYDIISVIYHASQACETCHQYATDAERENDKDAAAYFHRVQQQNADLVEQGKQLLKRRL